MAFGALLSVGAQAGITEAAKTCNSCTQGQIEMAVQDCGHGYGLVADFDAGTLYKGCWSTMGGAPAPGPSPTSPRIYYWAQPTANEYNSFQAYLGWYKASANHIRPAFVAQIHVNVPPKTSFGNDGGYMNALDMVSSGTNRSVIESWLNTTAFTPSNVSLILGSFAGSEANALSKAVYLLNSIKTGIVSFDWHVGATLIFHDGSAYKVTLNAFGEWNADPSLAEARDSHGNPIPSPGNVASKESAGVFDYSGAGSPYDMSNFIMYLKMFGAGVAGATGNRVACKWEPSISMLTCTKY